MSSSVILFAIISSTLLSPILNYLVHSRCSKISCCGCECIREVLPAENYNNDSNNNSNKPIIEIPTQEK